MNSTLAQLGKTSIDSLTRDVIFEMILIIIGIIKWFVVDIYWLKPS